MPSPSAVPIKIGGGSVSALCEASRDELNLPERLAAGHPHLGSHEASDGACRNIENRSRPCLASQLLGNIRRWLSSAQETEYPRRGRPVGLAGP